MIRECTFEEGEVIEAHLFIQLIERVHAIGQSVELKIQYGLQRNEAAPNKNQHERAPPPAERKNLSTHSYYLIRRAGIIR